MNDRIPIIGQTNEEKFSNLSWQEKFNLAAQATQREEARAVRLANVLGSQFNALAKALEHELPPPEKSDAQKEFKKMLEKVKIIRDACGFFKFANTALGFGCGLVTAGVIWWLV